ncbi:hypothetical protein GCM10010499_22030 [Streptomyces thermoviolaceus subsp. apingens]|jgi:hypothetical protein|nr:hypothetical protein GCM10010499_22030 [Streptomyces thermoviolaceus subsp. apingens]
MPPSVEAPGTTEKPLWKRLLHWCGSLMVAAAMFTGAVVLSSNGGEIAASVLVGAGLVCVATVFPPLWPGLGRIVAGAPDTAPESIAAAVASDGSPQPSPTISSPSCPDRGDGSAVPRDDDRQGEERLEQAGRALRA